MTTLPINVLVLHAPADGHHVLALRRAFECQQRSAGHRLVTFAVPGGSMCRSTIIRHVSAKADVVVHLLSPDYLAANPDWARSSRPDGYVLVADPVALDDFDLRSLVGPLPSRASVPGQSDRVHMRRLALGLLDLLRPHPPVREVLCMFANPIFSAPLALDREWREIDEVNRSAGSPLKLTLRSAARIRDLQDAMLDHPIDVLHFSGHGEPRGLCFVANEGGRQWVEVDRLVRVLANYEPRCLVLNACHSADTLDSVRGLVPYLVAMQGPSADRGSIEFSRAFYAALARGRSIPEAFRHARDSVQLHDEPCCPKLYD